MTVWLDENLDPELAAWLGNRFKLVAKHVREIGLQRVADAELFEAARRLNATVIVTKDSDFVDLVVLRGPPPQIIRLTCGNLTTPSMIPVLQAKLPEALQHLQAGAAWVEIG